MTTKIYGYGWVGKAMHTLFPDAEISDPNTDFSSQAVCDVAFVCVPTPLKDGKLDCSIVEDVIDNSGEELVVIRSTVNPGTTDAIKKRHPKRHFVFQPEYLGETVNHPMSDQHDRPFVIIGGTPVARRKLIELYTTIYNANTNIRQMTAYEAEVVKLTENRAIAFKVAQCQELYAACEKNGVDYYTIRDAVYGDDPRFNLWFTMIYPENRGFNSSKCLQKDVPAWATWADTKLTKDLLNYNNSIDSKPIEYGVK